MLARTRRRCGEQGVAVPVDGAAVVEDGAAVVVGDGAAGVVDDVVVVGDDVDVAIGPTLPSTVTMSRDCMAATVNRGAESRLVTSDVGEGPGAETAMK